MQKTIPEKKCPACNLTKASEDFYLRNKQTKTLTSLCKECTKIKVKDWQAKNTDKKIESQKRYQKNNRDKILAYRKKWSKLNKEKLTNARKKWVEKNPRREKSRRLEYSYGLTLEQYEQKTRDQLGLCAICGHVPDNGRMLCVDHCHKTGKIRGLLCNSCNLALGYVKDDIKVLKNAIKYIKDYD